MRLATLVVAIALLTSARASHADDVSNMQAPNVSAEKTEFVKNMLRRHHSDEAVIATTEAYRSRYIEFYSRSARLTDEQVHALVDRYILPAMKSRVDELMTMRAQLWGSKFTVDELRQIDEFYKTPAGQKIDSVMVELTREIGIAEGIWFDHVAQDAAADFRKNYAPSAKSE